MTLPRSADLAALAAGARALARNPVGLYRTVRAVRAHGRTLAGLLAGAAARSPEAVALVDRAGPVTARDLDRSADDVARLVRAAWSGRGRVGVQVGDHRGFVAAVVGVLRAGADAVLIGPRTGADALATVLAEQQVTLLVRDGDPVVGDDPLGALTFEPTEPIDPARASTEALCAQDVRPGAGRAGVPPGAASRGRVPRVVLLTAGTTGVPSAAPDGGRDGAAPGRVTTERPLPQLALIGLCGIRPGRPVLVLPPLFHGHGFAFLAAGLAVGAPVVLPGARTGAEICAAATRYAADVITGVPAQLQRLAGHLVAEHAGPEVACPHRPAPRRVVSGSDRLPPAVAATLTGALGDVVVNLFGSTQTGVLTAATSRDLREAPDTVGRALPGVGLVVLDDDGRPCRPGHVGAVVLVTGPLGRARHVPTGDRGAFDRSGRLVLHGRADDVVVCGGENVRPAAVAALLEAVPGVRAAVVGPVPDEEYGTRLVAEVVLEPGGPLAAATAPAALRDAVRSRLGPHAVPRSVRVVPELRRSDVGKSLLPR